MSVPGLSKTHFKRNTEIGDVKLYGSGIPYIYNCNERYRSCKSTKECKKIAKITQKQSMHTCVYQEVRNVSFLENLFSCKHRFEIRPFALLLTQCLLNKIQQKRYRCFPLLKRHLECDLKMTTLKLLEYRSCILFRWFPREESITQRYSGIHIK